MRTVVSQNCSNGRIRVTEMNHKSEALLLHPACEKSDTVASRAPLITVPHRPRDIKVCPRRLPKTDDEHARVSVGDGLTVNT